MQWLEHQFRVMGGPAQLCLAGPSLEVLQRVVELAEQEARRLEFKYSRFRPDSLLSQINAAAGSGSLVVDDETAGLLDYAATCVEHSDGLFDPTCGVLRQVWDFKAAKVPTSQQLKPWLQKTGWQHVRWQKPEFGLLLPGMQLDLGGVVKEYGVDRLVALCRAQGVAHGLINLAGDLAAIGPRPDGSAWQVGIRHPRSLDKAIAHIPLMQGGIATSGDYERFFVHRGKRYCHILNPKTGYPVSGLASVSVLAPQCLIAGSATTIALLLGKAKGLKFLRQLGLPWLAIDDQLQVHGCLN